jgi:hypothetical protein
MQFSKDLSDSEDDDPVELVGQKISLKSDTSENKELGSKLNGLTKKTENPTKNILQYFTSRPKSSTLLSQYTELQSGDDTFNSEYKYFFDDQIARLLSLLDEYFQFQKAIQTSLSNGFYNQSLAKYRQTTFSAQFPSTQDIKEEFTENIRMIPASSLKDGWLMVEKDENTKKEKENDIQEENEKQYPLNENQSNENGALRIASEESEEDGVSDDFRSVGTVERTSSVSENNDNKPEEKFMTSSHVATEKAVASNTHNEVRKNDEEAEETNIIQVPVKCQIILTNKSLEDYLLLFHGLPSTKLKQCQQDFYSILQNDLCEAVALKQQIIQLCNEIEECKGVISV